MAELPYPREPIDAELDRLLGRVREYRPDADVDLIQRAFEFAFKVHERQLRQSGEPYIMHPLAACHILADIESDEVAMAACMLHDAVEDCAQDEEREAKLVRERIEQLQAAGKRGQAEQLQRELSAQERFIEKLKDEVGTELKEEFGQTVADLVDGVTRLSAVRFADTTAVPDGEYNDDDEMRRRLQGENLRRMVVAAAKDMRVLIIKLADRLHNMQTLYAKRRTKQIKIARETEVIYAKLAERLGIWRVKWEMEDLSLRYLHPAEYFEIEQRVARTRDERMAEIDFVVTRIIDAVDKAGLKVDVSGRPKHLYSIYHKMLKQGIDFDEIYDLEAIRVICDNEHHCYMVLGIVHSLWPHQPEHFADYISNPKANGYRSIHTKVIVPSHGPMEVQIRTREMHREAEYGVAAHWRYKDDTVIDEGFAKRLTMMRQLFEMAKEGDPTTAEGQAGGDESDFMREVEASLWEEDIFVYTPKGEVIDLPLGATVVDFAYRIHTAVGHTCIGAKVNRRIVPLDHVLRNGDTCEILRQRNTGPSRDWLKFVRTATSRTRIRAYLRRKERESLVESGQQLLEAEAARQKLDLKELFRRDRQLPATHRRRGTDQPVEDVLTRVSRRRSFNTDEDLLIAVGDRIVSAEGVIHQILGDIEEAERAAGITEPVETIATRAPTAEPEQGKLSMAGATGLMFRRSKCCLPLPGDQIVGYLTRGQGIAIHRADCANVRHLREREPERVMQIAWEETQHALYDMPLEIRAQDRIGLLRDLAGLMSELGVNITGANTLSAPLRSSGDHMATIRLQLELVNRSQVDELVKRLPTLGVVKVTLRGQVFHDAEKSGRPRAAKEDSATVATPAGRARKAGGRKKA